jgi:propionyl-CoA carboxylase alpha chain
MEFYFRFGHTISAVRVNRQGDSWRVAVNGGEERLVRAVQGTPNIVEFQIGWKRHRIRIAPDGQKRWVANGSDVYVLYRVERAARHANSPKPPDEGSLSAAMPGQVVSVAVREGEEVAAGQTLVILEAMKMELRVTAPQAGRVQRVLVKTGQVVERGQQLVALA